MSVHNVVREIEAAQAAGYDLAIDWSTTDVDVDALTATSVAADGAGGVTSSSGGVGYATGAGGTVTQSTNKATTAALNKTTGAITMNAASLAAGATATFTLSNTAIAATDAVIVNHASAGTAAAYEVWAHTIAANSCQISVTNITAGALAEAIVLRFAVIKGVSA